MTVVENKLIVCLEINEKEKKIKNNEQQALLGLEFYRNRFGLQFEKLSGKLFLFCL